MNRVRYDCSCPDDKLCERCYGRELAAKRLQAGVLGQVWAEHVARTRGSEPAWPTCDPRTLEIARSKVAQLVTDPRLLEPLALACSEGAARWWARRPERYRS